MKFRPITGPAIAHANGLSTRSLVAPMYAETAPNAIAATAMAMVFDVDSKRLKLSRPFGYFTVKLALREEEPALSVSVYLPAARARPLCLRVSSKACVPDFAVRALRAATLLEQARVAH